MRAVTDFFIGNYVFAVILTVLILILGRVAYKSLPVEQNPDVTIPIVIVVTTYPGVSPEDIERDVTEKLEEFIDELSDFDYYQSISAEGVSSIVVVYKAGYDIEKALRDVRDKVDAARPELPEDADEPSITDFTTGDIPTVIISLASDRPEGQVKEIADKIESAIERMPQVNRVDVFGTREREIHIEVKPEKLELFGISAEQVINAVRLENRNVPAGNIDLESTRFTLLTPNRFKSLDDIENVVAAMRGENPIRVKDLATVKDSYAKRQTYGRINGTPSVNFSVFKKDHANTIETSRLIQEKLNALKSELPSDIEFTITGNQAEWASRNLKLMVNSAVGGVILVVLTIFLFLGFRNALLISLTLPISLTITFMWLWINGYSFNGVTLFGLVVVIGILVDDAIIIIENIYRWMESGYSRIEAAYKATHEVGPAILYAGATTIAAFFPMLIMTGTTGEFMKYIPITVIASILGAVFAAHTIMPALASRHLKLSKLAEKTGTSGHGFFSKVRKQYSKSINTVLRKPLLFPSIIFVSWLAAIGLVVSGALDITFFPKLPMEQFTYKITTAVGTTLDETNRIVEIAEERISQFNSEYEYLTANVGVSGARTFGFDSGGSGPSYGEIQGQLYNDDVKYIREMEAKMEETLKDIPGADIEMVVFQSGPPVDKPVVIRIIGKDFAVLSDLSSQVKESLENTEGLTDVFDNYDPSRPEISVKVDKPRAFSNFVSPSQIAMLVRLAFNGVTASKYFDEQRNESVDIVVKYPDELAKSPSQLSRLGVVNSLGNTISLNQIASVEFTTGIHSIIRRSGERTVSVRSDVAGISAFEGLKRARESLKGLTLPAGYSIEFAGENEERDESFKSLGIALLAAIFIIYLLMVLKFKSAIQPFVIMGAIPFSMVGAVLGLIITRNSFSILTFVGIIALSGIVVNDSIVLVDYINQLRERGMKKVLAIRKACLHRMRPILLTSITTIAGILPLATGWATGGHNAQALFWSPLGWAIIFGLIMSTILILLVVPSIYLMFTWFEEEYIPKLLKRKSD